MPTTGAKNGLKLSDMYGKDYDDADWDKLLDQLTFDDMDNLIANGGYGTQAVKSVGKIQLTDADGPASLNNNFTGVGSIGFPASTAFACTWNRDLAKQFGEMIGDMAHDMHVAGWYAPAMNIHRSAFSGRTFEYFSEDSLLSGAMASNEISGAKSKGVYSFMKHFALNDQETNRTKMVCTWTNEQAIRETYLKPFEMSVKEGGAQAVMSSFNYIGNTYAGASSNLLQTVLRGEWGFKGFVLTDYFGGYGYQNADQEVRAGNDSMLATTKITNHITDKSATSVKAMRQAAHNILYTAANSWQYANGEPKVATPIWKTAMYVAWGVTAAGATQEGAAQPAAAQSQENGDSAAADGADKAGAADGKADDTLTPLGQAKKEAAEYLEALQRERAEFINFRNRAQKEQERFRQHGIIDVLTALLPALDDIDRIREHSEMDDSFKAVANKIDKAFEKFGVEKFGEKGEDFDPTKHDAILHKPDPNAEKETVDTVVEAGYRIGDRVIRAARVVVASPQN